MTRLAEFSLNNIIRTVGLSRIGIDESITGLMDLLLGILLGILLGVIHSRRSSIDVSVRIFWAGWRWHYIDGRCNLLGRRCQLIVKLIALSLNCSPGRLGRLRLRIGWSLVFLHI